MGGARMRIMNNYSGQSSPIIAMHRQEGKRKELEHADCSEVEQQVTAAVAAHISTECLGDLIHMFGEVGSRDRFDPQV